MIIAPVILRYHLSIHTASKHSVTRFFNQFSPVTIMQNNTFFYVVKRTGSNRCFFKAKVEWGWAHNCINILFSLSGFVHSQQSNNIKYNTSSQSRTNSGHWVTYAFWLQIIMLSKTGVKEWSFGEEEKRNKPIADSIMSTFENNITIMIKAN